ncbi:hypothetical protein [Cellulosimicrobium sp. NPDC057862]|uniref:hypothetical protein n=1 Tax=Actinomycetes TaxID=1760 RepID=UPI0036734535
METYVYSTIPDDRADMDGVVNLETDSDESAVLLLGAHIKAGNASPRGPFTLVQGKRVVRRFEGPADPGLAVL